MNKRNFMKYCILGITILICFSHLLAISYSNEVGITDGMYIKHTYTCSQYPGHSSSCGTIFLVGVDSTLKFSKTSNDIFHVEWEWKDCATNSWDVNSSTRIVSNNGHISWGPDDDSHNFEWIYTDVSLDDQILLFNFWKYTDAIFNITGEAMLGSREVWQLEDVYGSVVWYDKVDGFLVNGTFRYLTDWEKFEFIEIGSSNSGTPFIPGYNILLLLGVLFLTGCILITNRKR